MRHNLKLGPVLSPRSRGKTRRGALIPFLAVAGVATLVGGSGCGSDSATSRKSGGEGGGGGSGGAGGGGTGGSFVPVGTGGSAGFDTGDGGVPPSGNPTLPDQGTPFVRDDTGGAMLDPALVTTLKAGGSGCTTPLIYPYEGTMFPAGGLPPFIQWAGDFDAAYVRMTFDDPTKVNYELAVGKGTPGRIQVPQDAWDGVSGRTPRPPAPHSPLHVTVTVKVGGTVSTCPLNLDIAPGKLDGVLYYNTYDDPETAKKIVGYTPSDQGSVMRLFLGQPKPDPFIWYAGMAMQGTGPCISCHSVSGLGSTMLATQHDYSAKVFKEFGYDIKTNTNPQPPQISAQSIQSGTFGALTPDGTRILTMGNPDCTGGAETYPRAPNNFPLVEGAVTAKLWDVKSAAPVTASGLSADFYMWMPQFSPTGDKVVFNHAKKGADGRTNWRELATMDFDSASNTFSNLQVIYHDDGPAPSLAYGGYTTAAGAGPITSGADGCKGTNTGGGGYYPGAGGGMTYNDTCTDLCYPGWPFFTPDGKKVIFVRGTEPDFAGAAPGLRSEPSKSRLFVLDVATKVAHPLDNANGARPDGSVYLPAAGDYGYDYFPTVMPIASGGEFWVFWTSRRTYGNFPKRVAPSNFSLTPDGVGLASKDSKKIWVTAIDIDAPDNVDPSHPPFFLLGQGDSGNLRAFPTLSPCKSDGTACGSGIDCCGGYCIDGTCNPLPPTQTCAMLNDKCTDSADCCEPTQKCYGGFCAIPPPPK